MTSTQQQSPPSVVYNLFLYVKQYENSGDPASAAISLEDEVGTFSPFQNGMILDLDEAKHHLEIVAVDYNTRGALITEPGNMFGAVKVPFGNGGFQIIKNEIRIKESRRTESGTQQVAQVFAKKIF